MALRIPAPRVPSASVIFLHGLGDSGQGWSFFPPECYARPSLQHINFVLPNAPNRFFPLFGATQSGWFDWPMSNSDAFAKGVFESVETVKQLIKAEIDKGVDPSRIVIGGFSQGAAITQCVASTYSDHKLAGFVSLSGFLPIQKHLLERKSALQTDAPIFMGHGTSDPVVPYSEAVNAQKQLTSTDFGFSNVTLHSYKGLPHSVNQEELDDILDFLEKVVPK